MKILYLRENETLRYAAEELEKYYRMMSGKDAEIAYSANASEDAVCLGLLADLSRPDEDVTDAVLP